MLRRSLWLLLVVILGASACTGSGRAPEGASGVTPAKTARADIRAEYESLAELARTLDDYNFRLVSKCMARQGFTYRVPGGEAPELFQKTYGFTEDEVIRGYPTDDDMLPPDPNTEIANGLDEATRVRYFTALFGPDSARQTHTLSDGSGELSAPGEGCIAEALQVMFGSSSDGSATMSLAINLPNTALEAAALDPVLKDLNERWSDCMDSRGHRDLTVPDEAFGEASALPAGSERGVRVARDDVQCEGSLDYTSTRRTVEDRYLTGVMDAKESEVVGAREALVAATTKAKTALATR